jgi:anti-sigma-K factor RskA
MSNEIEIHALVGAYAVDALDGEERARFERHLENCQACRDEFAGFSETAGRLAGAVATAPPMALKTKTMAAVAQTRQLPPQLAAHRAGGTSGSGSIWRRAAAAAAVVLVLAGSLGLGLGLSGSGSGPDQMSHEIAAVLSAPDAHMIESPVRTGGMATVVMSTHDASLVFVARGLPHLDQSQCYELWLVSGGGDQKVDILPQPSGAVTGPVLASDIKPTDRLGLSIEPASGSSKPTSSMLFLIVV